MTTTLQKLETDLSTVRLDLNSGAGAAGLTLIGNVDLGQIEQPIADVGLLQSAGTPGAVAVKFTLLAKGLTVEAVRTLAQQVATELATPGPYKVQLTGMTSALYFDAIGTSLGGLLRGQEDATFKIASLLTDDGLPCELVRLPYLYAAKLRSSANLLGNATLLKATTTANRPDLWAWDSTTGLSAEAMDWTTQAYTLSVATTGTRNLQQTTANSSMTGGSTYDFSVYAKLASGTARLTVAWQGKNNAGTVQGAEVTSAQTTLTTDWQRIEAVGVANASATKATVSLRFANAAATAVTVYLKQPQHEAASAATTFRTGTESVSNDPAAAMGRIMPVYVSGNARTRAILTITPESGSALVQARMARRNYGNLLEFMNTNHFKQAESMTAGTNTTLAVADPSSAASGTTARIWSGAASQTDTWAKRLRWQVAPADKTSIEGSFRVYARCKFTSVLASGSDAKYWLQLRWSAGNSDPVSFSNEIVPIDLTDVATDSFVKVDLGSVFVERGVATTYGLTMELWARREDGELGMIYVDHVSMMPQGPTASTAQDQSAVVSTRGWRDTDGANPERWLGSDLVPITAPTGVAAGSPDGDTMVLTRSGDGAGTPPKSSAGFAVATGRHTMVANVTLIHKARTAEGTDTIGAMTVYQTNATVGSIATKDLTIRQKLARIRKRLTLVAAVTDATRTYQFQVTQAGSDASANNESIRIHSITHFFTRTVTSAAAMLVSGEFGLASGRPVAQITASSTAVEPLRLAGPWIDLNPGLNLLLFDWGEVPAPGYEQADAREPLALDTYNRACSVALDYYPRYTT